ncbi:myosin-J heavy chain-like isoform X1 [Achlya hypogyna]|uniref:Myosin-J heavy chain-like isoform X1 n=1 Tax=Achlya hypogyna TaxID=1202772 RepID=A0A1V9YJG7_ACHHY|nr:myosin-J heavy chain-like isoform X1 [Achlya hypogyna]
MSMFHRRRSSAAEAPPVTVDNIVLEGWLKKKGHHFFSTIKSRYFLLLKDGTLVYYVDEKRKKQKGAVRLMIQDVVTPVPAPKREKAFAFELQKPSVDHDAKPFVLLMLAPTEGERTRWIEAMRKVMAASAPPVRLTTMLRSTMLNGSSRALVDAGTADVFGMLLEIGKLQELVVAAKADWGDDPTRWTSDQYLELCRSIVFTHEKAAGLSLSLAENQVLQDALDLRYQYEDAQAARIRLSSVEEALEVPVATAVAMPSTPVEGPLPSMPAEAAPESPAHAVVARAPLVAMGTRKYFETLDPSFVALSPRSKTMAKYASLYQQEALAARRSWSAHREVGDDLLETLSVPISTAALSDALARRFENDRTYTYVGDTLLSVNPAPRLLHHAAGNSIYDETTVFWYRDHDEAACSPHPFALAKRALASLRDFHDNECLVLVGESGSGKTDLAKHVLKYVATIQQALRPPPVRCGPSSNLDTTGIGSTFHEPTKSTIKMRSDEAHLIDLLDSKQVPYETIYLDINPERWPEMLAVSHGVKQLPQVHMDRMFFGPYDELQRLEDEEQFVFYVKNPRAARLMSILLDGNVLLETFGNATTMHNPNSSRFAKSIAFQTGGAITTFFLETSRVTNTTPTIFNFHAFYALLMGGSASLLAELRLDTKSPASFAYLGNARRTTTAPNDAGTFDQDRQRWHQVLRCFDLVGVSEVDRLAVFRVLAAVLYLGNLTFGDVLNTRGVAEGVKITSTAELEIVGHLLGMDPVTIEQALCTKRLLVAKSAESFDLHVHQPRALNSRDTLARLLYQGLFQALVALLNQSTAPGPDAPTELKTLTLIDVFGFEVMATNSFEQLCINFLTEKLAAFHVEHASETQCALYFAEGLDAAWPAHGGSVLRDDGPGMRVLESPVGVWACLDEATLLHGNDEDSNQVKNSRFVRALYLRNVNHPGLLPEQTSLQFTVVRATDFVAKNSDAMSPAIQALLPASSNAFVQRLAAFVTPPPTKRLTSVSSQYKAHVQVVLAQLREAKPHFVHCFRPRPQASTEYFSLDPSLLTAQVNGHMLAQIATWSSLLFRHHTPLGAFQQRYRTLFPPPTELKAALSTFTDQHLPPAERAAAFAIGATLLFHSDALHVALQRRRDEIRTKACVILQSALRMWQAKVRVRAMLQSSRQYADAIRAFYTKYNPAKLPQVAAIIRAYRGREAELLAKLELKYAKTVSDHVPHEAVDTSLETFILSVKFDATTVQKMLLDPKMALFLSEPSILQALREVSLDPSAIYLQTSEPVLRLFYTELRKYLQPAMDPTRVVYQRLPLAEAIALLAQNRLLVPTPAMTPVHAKVVQELAAEPQLLPFHIDEPGVRELLNGLIRSIDGDISDIPEPEMAPPLDEPLALKAVIVPHVEQAPCAEPVLRYQDMPLEEAVERLAQASLLVPTTTMTLQEQAVVAEIAQDPSMFVFLAEDPAVCELLHGICRLVDGVIASATRLHDGTRFSSDLWCSTDMAVAPPTMAPTAAVPVETAAAQMEPLDTQVQASSTPVVELKRIKVTQKLLKRVMNDDAMMSMMAEPVVTEFFEEFSEDTAKTPTITFRPEDTAVIEFYTRLLEISDR